ncbi:putative olfactory receptor 11A1-like [Penaeus vannamei]|uniref:Putative olfactory receptor 11A1-like n=1 Tax=Penaeus vannamei TaxID=6689 RepID=A0A3R7PDU5_PENVA|nr:putative olfactory receptor 11A1-like [Penaeus vannamei]
MVEACMNNDLVTDGIVLKRNRKTQTDPVENGNSSGSLDDSTSTADNTKEPVASTSSEGPQPQERTVILLSPPQEESLDTQSEEDQGAPECEEIQTPPQEERNPIAAQRHEASSPTQEEEEEDPTSSTPLPTPLPLLSRGAPPSHTKKSLSLSAGKPIDPGERDTEQGRKETEVPPQYVEQAQPPEGTMERIFSHPQGHRGKDSDKEKLQRSTGDKKHIDTRTQLGKGNHRTWQEPQRRRPPLPHTRTQGVHTETTCGQQRSDNIPPGTPNGTGNHRETRDIGNPGGNRDSGTPGPRGTGTPETPTEDGINKDKKTPHGPKEQQEKGSGQKKREDQLSLLHKGRSFVPGPPRKSIQLEALSSSLGKLEDDANRNFTEALLPGQKILPTREKRKWPPQLPAIPRKKESPRKMPGLHEKVTEHMQKLEKEIHTQKRPNLSKKERAALDLLKKDANIVIKKADKDGALVVLKTESYIKMGNQHLRDKETYETVGNPEEALQAVTRESKLLVNRFHTLDNIKEKVRSFTAGQRDALLQHKASIPHWYVLPKTHKAIMRTQAPGLEDQF